MWQKNNNKWALNEDVLQMVHACCKNKIKIKKMDKR